MPTLAAIRSLDTIDPLPWVSGEKSSPPKKDEAPRKGREEVRPGIWRRPDGKLETDLPPPVPPSKHSGLTFQEVRERIAAEIYYFEFAFGDFRGLLGP